MLTEQNTILYHPLNTTLAQQQIGLTAAELHGLLSGIICGGNCDTSWQTLLHELTNDGMAFSSPLDQMIRELYSDTEATLEDNQFLFQPLLPEEQHEVFTRIDALVGWVNHFLLGFGMIQPKLDKLKGDVGEAIEDLRSIGQLGYDLDDDLEELEHSFEEVLEYVRVAAMLCYTEFTHTTTSTIKAAHRPTLH